MVLAPSCIALASFGKFYRVLIFRGSPRHHPYVFSLPKLSLELCNAYYCGLGAWRARLWFEQWGEWAVLVAAFISPLLPGVTAMPLALFILASLVGRGIPFSGNSANALWGSPDGSHITEIY